MELGITKICENCKQTFLCCCNDIEQCHCYNTNLTTQTRGFLQENFKDCLCNNCLNKGAVVTNLKSNVL